MRLGSIATGLVLATTAGVASAQGWSSYNGTSSAGPGIGAQLGKIDTTIRDGRRTGQLSRGDARALRRETGQIGVLADRYAEGGLSESERAELQTRTEVMRAAVNAKRSQSRR